MTSTTSGTPSVASSNPTTFSYAQAAKGRVTATATSAMQSSQGSSGVSTPAKDANSAVNTPSASVNGALGSENGDRSVNGSYDSAGRAGALEGGIESTSKSTTLVDANSSPSSPSFGTASTSTLPKEEDLNLGASVHTGAVWDKVDRKSHAAHGGEKSSDATETKKGRNKGRKKEKAEAAEKEKAEAAEKEAAKLDVPLVAAPLPTVNIWQQRMATQPSKAKPSSPVVAESAGDSLNSTKPSDTKRRGKASGLEGERLNGATPNGGAKDASVPGKGAKKGSDSKDEPQSKRLGTRGNRVAEKEEKLAASQLPPPVEDAFSWPTPEIALEEEKRKAKVTVAEKDEKEDVVSSKPRQKKEWVPVPYTPSVTFNTPIPQRGGRGRGGGRGGRDAGGRGNHVSNGSIGGDKAQASNTATNANGDVRERGRDSASSVRAPSVPPNASSKQNSSDGSQNPRDQRKAAAGFSSDKPKSGNAAKGEFGSTTGATQLEAFDNSHAIKNEAAKGSKSDQFQAGVNEGDFNPRFGNERRSEPNTRGPENAKEASGFSRDTQQARDRTDARTERGRGGYRGRGGFNNVPTNQQHPQHAYTNGHGPALANGYPIRQNGPYSPPPQQVPFGNQYSQPPGRARGGHRSGSIPNNGIYPGRYTNGNGPQIPPLQTGPSFDYSGMQPVSAGGSFNPYVEQYSVLNMVTMQLEYYFSINNLCKDVFLRKHMDSQGFVFLSFIAGFKRITALTQEFELLRFACHESEEIDIIRGDDGFDRVRRKDGWEKWVLPMTDRDEAARNEGPQNHHRTAMGPRLPQSGSIIPGHAAMSPTAFSPNGIEPHFAQYRGGPGPMIANGNGHFQPETPLSAAVPEFAPGSMSYIAAPDPLEVETTFTDDEVHKLTLVYSSNKSNEDPKPKPFHNFSSRTFSNGSIDAKTLEELNDNSRSGRGMTNRNGSHAGDTSPTSTRRSRSPSIFSATTSSSFPSLHGPCVMWKKGQNDQVPLPNDKNEEPYYSARQKALNSRELSQAGETSPDMKILYEFWSHFLCRNFNPKMYREFRNCALEDASLRKAMDGINNLITYYDETLRSKKKVIPEVLAQHYLELVKNEDPTAERLGFAKLRSAWRNGALDMKSRKKIDNLVDPQLRAELEC